MPVLVSNGKLAVHLGCLPPVITKYEALGVIEKTAAGKFDQDLCRVKAFSYLRELAAGRSGKKHTNQGGPDLSTERAKLAQQQTEAARMKNAVAAGQFVPVAIVVEAVSR
jgi:phage terminase Nu1 subunit (DNA packaging protein)